MKTGPKITKDAVGFFARFVAVVFLSFPFLVGCVENPSESSNEPNSFTLEELVARTKAAPDVTDNEIAWFLSRGQQPMPYRVNDKRESRVVMWQGPLRISIEDGQGRDLDLSTYPGSIIKYYLTSLTEYTNLPITITKAARHDNNASIVISKSRLTGDAGTIYGVPELADRPHKGMSGVLLNYYIPRYDGAGPEETSAAQFTMGYVNKACAENIIIPDSSPEDPQYIFNHIGGFIGFCLGPENTGIGFPGVQPKVALEWEKHTFFFWNTFYNSGIKPGMNPPEAYGKLLDYLKYSHRDNGGSNVQRYNFGARHQNGNNDLLNGGLC